MPKNETKQMDSLIDFGGLIDWYKRQCDGEWEHQMGIRLETLDNPGWILTVDLIHTNLQGISMPGLFEGCNPDGHPVSPNWIHCTVKENKFRGACDPDQLPRLIHAFEQFRSGAESNANSHEHPKK